MLVLARKVGERLVIDEQITVTIIEVRGDRVKLAITAPSTALVDRTEVWQRQQPATEDLILTSQAAETVPVQ